MSQRDAGGAPVPPARTLAGLRVLVTRAAGQAGVLSGLLRERGAEPVELPLIQIVPPADPAPLDAALARIEGYHWVVFTSANAVDAVFARLDALGRDARVFDRCRIAACGSGTAARLAGHGLSVDLIPGRFVAEDVRDALIARGVAGQRVLLPRAAQARDVLPEGLRAAGAEVDDVPAYRTVPAPPSAGLDWLLAGEIDIVTLTSASTARNLAALVGQPERLGRTRIACIGPITAEAARAAGLRVDIIAEEYSIPGLVAALERAQERSRS